MKKRIVLNFDLEQVCNDVLAKCNLVSKTIKDEAADDIKTSILEPDNPETRSIINRAVTEAFGRVKVACQKYLTIGRTEDDNRLERLVKSVTFAQEPREVQAEDGAGHLLYTVEEYLYKDGGNYYGQYSDSIFNGSAVSPLLDSNNQALLDDQGRQLYTSTGDNMRVIIYRNLRNQWVLAGADGLSTSLHGSNGVITLNEGAEPTPMMTEKLVDTDVITNIVYETITLILAIDNFNLAVTDDLKSAIHKYVVDYVMGRFLQDQHVEKAGEYKTLADGEDYKRIIKDLNCRDTYTMRKPSFM